MKYSPCLHGTCLPVEEGRHTNNTDSHVMRNALCQRHVKNVMGWWRNGQSCSLKGSKDVLTVVVTFKQVIVQGWKCSLERSQKSHEVWRSLVYYKESYLLSLGCRYKVNWEPVGLEIDDGGCILPNNELDLSLIGDRELWWAVENYDALLNEEAGLDDL